MPYPTTKTRMRKNWLVLALVAGVICLVAIPAAHAQSPLDGPVATASVIGSRVEWQPTISNDGMVLTVAGPGGFYLRQEFAAESTPFFDAAGRPDGPYTYELKAIPVLDKQTRAMIENAREPEDRQAIAEQLVREGKLPAQVPAQSGGFTLAGGSIVAGGQVEPEPGSAPPGPPGDVSALDQVIADDMIVQGSLCVGFDCVNGESFGFDTIRLKENNLRIRFEDTSSTAGFPTNDWQIIINDSASGGNAYFAVEDSDAGRQVFKIEAGAPTGALYVDSWGDVGAGTSTPAMDVHAFDGDTPGIRLEQAGGGWAPQTWDIAGNEANFFVRDVTNGSLLPFRIRPGAPTNSLYVDTDGNVGIGTDSTPEKLNVDGNVYVDGYVTEFSDANAKENFAPVDGQEVLEKLSQVPISTWSYKDDDPAVRHMGPMAQDFYAVFGLGKDDRHIAPLDTNGVALAAAQQLYRMVQERDAQIEALRCENAELAERLEALEQAVDKLLQEKQ